LPDGTFLQQSLFAGRENPFICSGFDVLHHIGAKRSVTVQPIRRIAVFRWHGDCIGQNIISFAWFYARLHRTA
jgi:hypothetical protein